MAHIEQLHAGAMDTLLPHIWQETPAIQLSAVLPTPGKIIRPGHKKNSAAGRKILPYPAAACMIIVDLYFFTTIQTIFWRAVTQRQINVKSNVIQYTERDYIF